MAIPAAYPFGKKTVIRYWELPLLVTRPSSSSDFRCPEALPRYILTPLDPGSCCQAGGMGVLGSQQSHGRAQAQDRSRPGHRWRIARTGQGRKLVQRSAVG